MTCNSNQQLERVPTNSSSPYFQEHLRVIRDDLILQHGVDFSTYDFDEDFEVNDDKGDPNQKILKFCSSALTRHFRQLRATLKTTDGLDADLISEDLRTQIATRKTEEAKSWSELVDFKGLDIANGVAEFSERSRPWQKKDLYLNLIAGGKRNQGIGIYLSMWGHLGMYAAELNESKSRHSKLSYIPEFGADLTSHLNTLPPAADGIFGVQLARLGRTVIGGSLQGSPENPTNVILKLKQKTSWQLGRST